MTWLGLYVVIGIAIALWLARSHYPPYTVTTLEWFLAIAIWPIVAVAFPFMLYHVVRSKLKERE